MKANKRFMTKKPMMFVEGVVSAGCEYSPHPRPRRERRGGFGMTMLVRGTLAPEETPNQRRSVDVAEVQGVGNLHVEDVVFCNEAGSIAVAVSYIFD